jgi:hypothetical protein
MYSAEAIEKRAKEALGTLSLADYVGDWECQKSYQTVFAINRISQTARTKERNIRIKIKGGSHHQLKTLLIPKKIKFEDHSLCDKLENRSRQCSTEGRRKLSYRKMSESKNETTREKVYPVISEIENVNLMKYWFRHRGQ